MEVSEIKNVRLQKLEHLQSKGISVYGGKFERSETIEGALRHFTEGREVVLAGRLVANRKHGKVVFIDLQDQSAKIQLYIKTDIIGDETFEVVADLDIGDIIGVKGELFKTQRG